MAGNHMSELSPRQRMINMMYLVLTALLALNVSKEVLKAFQRMDNSLEFSYGETNDYNEKQYKAFKNRAEKNPEKFNEWYKKNFPLISCQFPLALGWSLLYLAMTIWVGVLILRSQSN